MAIPAAGEPQNKLSQNCVILFKLFLVALQRFIEYFDYKNFLMQILCFEASFNTRLCSALTCQMM